MQVERRNAANGNSEIPSKGRKIPSICIIAQNAYGALLGGNCGHIGGAERQTALMARWLAAKGYRVCLVTWDEGQDDFENIDGVSVVKLCRADAGLPGFRFFYPRLTSLFSALKRANTDLYYHNSAEYVTGLAAFWCRQNGRRFIYSVASDVACESALPALGRTYERVLYRYGVRSADKLIVQTHRQRELLQESFGRDSVALPMPSNLLVDPGETDDSPPTAARVAWVGRVDTMKRMEWLLDIAERMPDIQFDVVAANMDLALQYTHLGDYARGLHARAKSMANVVWHGTLPQEKVAAIYRHSTCLCCTSTYEGFPNTFLEAWSQGRPVVSSFDPDGLIRSRQMGEYATSVDEFVAALRRLVISRDTWRQQSRNCREYFFDTHATGVAMPRFERELFAPLEARGAQDAP